MPRLNIGLVVIQPRHPVLTLTGIQIPPPHLRFHPARAQIDPFRHPVRPCPQLARAPDQRRRHAAGRRVAAAGGRRACLPAAPGEASGRRATGEEDCRRTRGRGRRAATPHTELPRAKRHQAAGPVAAVSGADG
ncbi:hypothetical protein PVAP13_5KG490107 [Panicum virgatum]|uniref:Uncharacterized protein n=1 Tax=Panicum virgatum TaxID=38727 RepID=A0A8T0SSL6_PANVG|nr:hypothetical protein PVAP13_5KG490107 [Panicum virgatum]